MSIDLLLKEKSLLNDKIDNLERENALLREKDKYANSKISVTNDLTNDRLCIKFQNDGGVLASKTFSIKELEDIIKQLRF